jgi:hypothetical protein
MRFCILCVCGVGVGVGVGVYNEIGCTRAHTQVTRKDEARRVVRADGTQIANI